MKLNENLLMLPGVVEIEEDVLKLGSEKLFYNRKHEFQDMLGIVFENLKYVHQTTNPCLLVSSSGTGVMEGALTNILSQNETALFVNGGVFGQRWGDISRYHQIKTVEIKKESGVPVKVEEIKLAIEKNPEIKAVFLTHNETSTGTITDIRAIAKLIKGYPGILLAVDCISSILVEEVKAEEWGIDVVVSSSNKALALPPGMGFMCFSEKALEKIKTSDNRLLNFDALEYIKEYKRNSTPYTPPVTLVRQLDLRLKKIKSEGLENVRLRYKKNTDYLREGILNLGLNFYTQYQGNCISSVLTPHSVNAEKIVEIMRDKHHIDLAMSWPGLKDKLFRVANFGNINKPEIDRFLNALQDTIKELR